MRFFVLVDTHPSPATSPSPLPRMPTTDSPRLVKPSKLRKSVTADQLEVVGVSTTAVELDTCGGSQEQRRDTSAGVTPRRAHSRDQRRSGETLRWSDEEPASDDYSTRRSSPDHDDGSASPSCERARSPNLTPLQVPSFLDDDPPSSSNPPSVAGETENGSDSGGERTPGTSGGERSAPPRLSRMSSRGLYSAERTSSRNSQLRRSRSARDAMRDDSGSGLQERSGGFARGVPSPWIRQRSARDTMVCDGGGPARSPPVRTGNSGFHSVLFAPGKAMGHECGRTLE